VSRLTECNLQNSVDIFKGFIDYLPDPVPPFADFTGPYLNKSQPVPLVVGYVPALGALDHLSGVGVVGEIVCVFHGSNLLLSSPTQFPISIKSSGVNSPTVQTIRKCFLGLYLFMWATHEVLPCESVLEIVPCRPKNSKLALYSIFLTIKKVAGGGC